MLDDLYNALTAIQLNATHQIYNGCDFQLWTVVLRTFSSEKINYLTVDSLHEERRWKMPERQYSASMQAEPNSHDRQIGELPGIAEPMAEFEPVPPAR
jgi:hypothetical protein